MPAIVKQLKSYILNFNSYQSAQIKVIGYNHQRGVDWPVIDKLSFGQWIDTHHKYSNIKIEGLECDSCILRFCSTRGIKNIHAFYNQKSGYSFKWHSDDLDVLLIVVKGYKRLEIKNSTYNLRAGDSVIIPKGYKHRAWSSADTWALSVGLQ